MNKFYFFLFLVSVTLSSASQTGCNDSAATNYNPLAISNDGSCTYPITALNYAAKGSMMSFANESSGVVYTNGALWTHNDSGNPSKLFKTDTASGALLQTLSLTNFPNTDWEDITADSAFLYIADCGNNNGTRTDLKILKISKNQFLNNTLAVVNVTAQAINFSYADQTSFTSNSNTNFDCEALISIADSLYLFTKNSGDYQTRVYKLPKVPGTYTISPYTSFNVNGKITGAAYNKQTKEVALIGYLSSHKSGFTWFLNDYKNDLFFSGNKRRIELGNSTNDWQTEGIDYASANELFITCESSYVPATLYTTSKMNLISVSVAHQYLDANMILMYPNPSNGYVTVDLANTNANKISIYDIMGKEVMMVKIETNLIQMDVLFLENGIYTVVISIPGENNWVKKFTKL